MQWLFHGRESQSLQPRHDVLSAAIKMGQSGEALGSREMRGRHAVVFWTLLQELEEMAEHTVRRYRVRRVGTALQIY